MTANKTLDLLGLDPAERIPELERENKELRVMLRRAQEALNGLRPALVGVHEAMEAVGQIEHDIGRMFWDENYRGKKNREAAGQT